MTWRRPIMAAIVLAILVAVFAAGEWSRHKTAQREEARERLFHQDPQNVVRLEIENEEGRIVLARGENGWRLVEPLDDQADVAQVLSLLQILDASITLNRFATTNLKEYGLDDPAASVRVEFKDGAAVRVLVGDDAPQPQKVYATIEGSGEVFIVNRAVRVGLEKEAFDFRDKTIIPAVPESVMSVRLENADGVMEAVRDEPGGPWRLIQPLEYPADPARMESLLRRLHINKLLAYVDPEDASTTATAWFDRPAATISITWRPPLSDDLQTAVLAAGPGHEAAKAWYARRPEKNDLFLIGSEVMEELSRAPDQFRDKVVFSLRPADVASVEMTLGRETYTLLRTQSGRWIFSDDPESDVFQRGTDLFVENLLTLHAELFVTDSPGPLQDYGLEPPRLMAIVHGAGGEMEGLAIGALSPEKSIVYARPLGGNVVLGLKWTALSAIFKFRIDLTDKQLIDPRIVNDDVVRIITTEGGETRILERRGDKVSLLSAEGKSLGEVSPVSALDYVTRYAALQFHRVVQPGDVAAADAGLDKPVFAARLENDKGEAVATVEFGAMLDDKIFMRFDENKIYLMKLDDWKDLTTLYRRLLK